MEITLKTKVADLLKEYPFLEEELIKINPKFKKLKNPILRKTVAKVATLKQAAVVGGMDPLELVNSLRALVGQKPLEGGIEEQSQELPEWITKEPKAILDANELLDSGKNPLAEVIKALKNLQKGDFILLKSDFKPQPLIDELIKKGYEVVSLKEDEEHFLTYIKVA